MLRLSQEPGQAVDIDATPIEVRGREMLRARPVFAVSRTGRSRQPAFGLADDG